jgi:dTDP-4-dehydrorhamnose 3,5-epimerase-like enzyme
VTSGHRPLFCSFLHAPNSPLSHEKLPTKIHDAWLLKPKIFGDARGFFLESWNRETFREIGLDLDFVPDKRG